MNHVRCAPQVWLLASTTALLLLSVAPASAQQASRTRADGAARVVVHSASGGISKGAYQGGVDWTISEFLRRQANEDFRLALGLEDSFRLGSVTGASAGNINALFAALAWCTQSATGAGDRPREPIPAEQSLFWKAWIETGVSELLPLDIRHLAEPAAFSRVFFETRQKDYVRTFMTDARPVPGCTVPVGLTMTKLTPIEVAIVGRLGSATVQRFSSVFDVVSRERLEFAFPNEDLVARKESLGAMALLPSLKQQGLETREVRLTDVFDVVLASSAFPVAFATKQICYEPGGLMPNQGGTERRCARFTDGGVFDNNPLGLAVRLEELTRVGGQRATNVEVAYTSPDSFRKTLRDARADGRQTPDRHGLAAILQLGSGAVASARQYELQSLARQFARDTEAAGEGAPRALLLQSSRGTPIVGETLNSFGAFLGRPFRVYDFYAGVYDGLEFVARRFLCAKPPRQESIDDCTAREHVRLLERNLFDLSPDAAAVSMWLRDLEYSPQVAPPTAVTALQPRERLVLEAIHQQFAPRRTEPLKPARCETVPDPIEKMLCPGGLDDALQKLSRNAAVREAARSLLASAGSGPQSPVDKAFVDLLMTPRRQVYRLAKKAIENIEHGEDAIAKDDPTAPEYSAWVEAGFSVFRASTLRYRDGIKRKWVELNMSTGRWDNEHILASVANAVSPNYVMWSTLRDGEDPVMLGWRPVTLAFHPNVFIGTQVEWSLRQPPVAKTSLSTIGRSLAYGVSVGSFGWHPLRTTTIEAGVLRMPEVITTAVGSEGRWAGRVSGRWVADKLTTAVVFNRSSLVWQLGVSDLNGIVYWLLR